MSLGTMSLEDLFDGIDSSLKVDKLGGDSENTIFEVSRHVRKLSEHKASLGKPIRMARYKAIVRHAPAWLAPRTGFGNFDIDRRGVLLVIERSDGSHVAILPSSGTADHCTTYVESSHGAVRLRGLNDSKTHQDKALRVLVGHGPDVKALVKSLFAVLLNRTEDATPSLLSNWTPEWYDGLIYCTWNGLGGVLTHNGIINALEELQRSGILISGIIVDDGWQTTNSQRHLLEFEADKQRFPAGLKGFVSDIREKFPYIQDIGVWSTLTGYWNGFEPGSKLDHAYKTVDCDMTPGHIRVRIVDAPDVPKFYDDYFKFLSDSGINCAKIDYQASIDELTDPLPRGKLWKVYQDCLFEASHKYFGGKVIYCMAMVPNIMLYSLGGGLDHKSRGSVPVFRNSDDFFPNVLSSHFWHVYTNLYTTLYTSNLLALPDFDMFQTKLQSGWDPLTKKVTSLHAAARCISGGPIYFTDTPRVHDIDLLKSFSAPGKSNRFVVLRPESIATTIDPYKPYESRSIHWATNSVTAATSESTSTTYLYGAFNLSSEKLEESISFSELRESIGIDSELSLVFKEYGKDEIHTSVAGLPIVLDAGEWSIFTAAPLISVFESESLALFGLLDNICGVAAIHAYDIKHGDKAITLLANLKAYGIFGFYASFAVGEVTASVDGQHLDGSRVTQEAGLVSVNITETALVAAPAVLEAAHLTIRLELTIAAK